MVGNALLHAILRDERLTQGLGDAEARVLVEWLVEQAEDLERRQAGPAAEDEVKRLCRRGRGITRFVVLWGLGQRGAAGQLAVTERFAWPLPDGPVDLCELMQDIIAWEDRERRSRQGWQGI
jgi:hypothetical protein